LRGGLARRDDRRLVVVEAGELRRRVGLRHDDRRRAVTAADVDGRSRPCELRRRPRARGSTRARGSRWPVRKALRARRDPRRARARRPSALERLDDLVEVS
jgi:hypothetical protein